MTSGVLRQVCIVHELHEAAGTVGRTAIDKRPVAGPVKVRTLGLYGDVQADREHHGGEEKALYAFSADEHAHWGRVLGAELEPGCFGENLLIDGDVVDQALIGERWRIGEVEVEVTGPRTPCRVFADWLERRGWVKEFTQRGRPGVYLRVLSTGKIQAGDTVLPTKRPAHGVSVSLFFAEEAPSDARALLEAHEAGHIELAQYMQAPVRTVAGREA